jgi:hypothetical protein
MMKTKALIILLMFYAFQMFAQTQWTKYDHNPVLTKGPSDWDIIAIGQPTCLFENDTIKMWYAGVGNDMKARICYALSTDGIHWIKYNNGTPVLYTGNPGEWDCGWLDTPEVVRSPDGYFLYYYGDTVQQPAEINSAYGVATSPDGINWTKYTGNPVLTKSNPADWDGKWIESPAVVYDSASSTYQMWYNGVSYNNWLIKVGYATSPDGISWTKYTGNPVVDVGANLSFDDMWVGTPAVIKRNDIYEMWYSGFCSVSGFDTLRIGYATSSDGITWNKYAGNPLFSTVTDPYDSLVDDGGPWAPDVIFDLHSEMYKMLFETDSGFLLATAPYTYTSIHNYPSPGGEKKLLIYPNPCFDKINIQNYSDREIAKVELYNTPGCIKKDYLITASDGLILLDVRDLSTGIYIVKIYDTKNNIYSAKIVKQ